jgi:putative NADPH-quinone reductase
MKKILIIQANSRAKSLCGLLADAYQNGAKDVGAQVKMINLGELKFDPILWDGYEKIQTLEPDLLRAQENIKWADHLVFIYPTWWGGLPALFKGFIDRIFLPNFAFKFKKDSSLWDKLLSGKTASLIITMDAPYLYHKIFIGSPGYKMMKKAVLEFCGVKISQTLNIGNVKSLTEQQKKKIINKVEALGRQM